MNEYLISVKSNAPKEWMEIIESQTGVIIRAKSEKYLLIKCNKEIGEKIRKEFEYLTVDHILADYSDRESA